MRKKTVLHVVTAVTWRGGEQQVAYLLEELREKVNAVVLCSKGSKMEDYCDKNGFKYFTHLKKRSIDIKYAKKIAKISKSEKVDCLHLHDAHAHTFAILAAVIYKNKAPIILSRRVDFPINNNRFSKFKYNHPNIKKILCVSNKIKEITARRINNKSVLQTVYSGIDLDKFEPKSGVLKVELELENSNFLIGNTSALADHKDYFTFIDVVVEVLKQQSNVHFVIFGSGPMEAEIKEYATTKGVGEKLKFLGFRSDVPKLLADLDLFLITSKTEGLGTSILDAFACKVPVVATAAGGIPELVEDRKTGLLCAIKNVEQITKAVLEVKFTPNLGNQMAENAFEKVQKFSKKETAKETLKHYSSF